MAKRMRPKAPYQPRRGGSAAVTHFLKEWRLFRSLTQEQVAERAEMSVSSVSQLENGEQGVSDRALAAMAHAYGVEIGDLFRDPTRPDYALWLAIKEMGPDKQALALSILKAVKAQAA